MISMFLFVLTPMNNQAKLIATHISALSGSQFQDLCDSLLYQIYREHILLLSKIGSHATKDKTIKGTPDTLIQLKDGSVVFVESTTTDEKELFAKLKSDVMCCLSLKAPCHPSDVKSIILCYNSKLDGIQSIKLSKISEPYGILIQHYDLARIAEELSSYYPWIADLYFATSLCNGSINSLDGFLDNYNNSAKRYSYPLTNLFKYREEELYQLTQSITNSPITIVCGNTGVGKTRICTEAMTHLHESHKYLPICINRITDNTISIIKQCTSGDDYFVLFVDDANLMDNLCQLTHFLCKDGRIRLLLTVKTFALTQVVDQLVDYQPTTIAIEKFSDDQIKGIISDSPFNIKHFRIQSQILELAQGNARLAAMISSEVIRAKSDAIFKDMAKVYDVLFDKVYRILLDKETNLKKTLCLVSILRSFSIGQDLYKRCFSFLSIESQEFYSHLTQLDKLDFVDFMKSSSGESVRVADQMLARYIIYKYLFEESIIDIEQILSTFFRVSPSQINEAIYTLAESYGFEMIEKKFRPAITACIDKESDIQTKIKYIETFSVFIPNEALCYYSNIIRNTPKCPETNFRSESLPKEFSWRYNKVIHSLVQFLHHKQEYRKISFDLLIEYNYRDNSYLAETVYWMRQSIIYPPEDITEDFSFSNSILDLLTDGIESDSIRAHLFFALAKNYLAYDFRLDRRKGKNLSMLMYTLHQNEKVAKFRSRVWNGIFLLFDSYPEQVRDVLMDYGTNTYKADKGIVESDIDALWPFLIKRLKPHNLMDVVLLNRIHRLTVEKKLSKKRIIPKRFDTVGYRFYRFMKYTPEDYGYDYRKYIDIKQKELSKIVSYTTLGKVRTLCSKILRLKDLVGEQTFTTNFSNTITPILLAVMDENKQFSVELFFNLLDEMPDVLKRDRTYMFRMYEAKALRMLEQKLFRYKGKHAHCLQLTYLELLAKDEITNTDGIHLLHTLENFQGNMSVRLDRLRDFPNYELIISEINRANEREHCQLTLDAQYFSDVATYFCNDLELAKKSYFQQCELNRTSFDYKFQGLKTLFIIDKTVVQEFIKRYCLEDCDRVHRNFSFVFGSLYDYEVVANICDMLSQANLDHLHYHDVSFDFLFNNIDKNANSNVEDFMQKYYQSRKSDPEKLSLLFRAARRVSYGLYEKIVVDFIDTLNDKEPFFEIEWWPRSCAFYGDTTMGDIEINRWNSLLPLVDKSKNLLTRIDIRRQICKFIEYASSSREDDRRRIFEEDA